MVFAEFNVAQVVWSMVWFFLFFVWIMLLFRVFGDIFRSADLSGFAKVLWLVFVIAAPYLGVFVYLIVRGKKMAENDLEMVKAQDAAMQEYIRSAAGGAPSAAAELERLAALKEQGVIDDAEFAAAKAKILS